MRGLGECSEVTDIGVLFARNSPPALWVRSPPHIVAYHALYAALRSPLFGSPLHCSPQVLAFQRTWYNINFMVSIPQLPVEAIRLNNYLTRMVG